jgi:hypothetical protein
MALVYYLKTLLKRSEDASERFLWGRCYCLSEHRQPDQSINKDGILVCMTCRTYIAGGYPHD